MTFAFLFQKVYEKKNTSSMHLGHHLSDATQITDPLPSGFAFKWWQLLFFFSLEEENKTKKPPKNHSTKKPNSTLVRKTFKVFQIVSETFWVTLKVQLQTAFQVLDFDCHDRQASFPQSQNIVGLRATQFAQCKQFWVGCTEALNGIFFNFTFVR